MDGSEVRRLPVEVGSFNPLSQVVVWDSERSTVAPEN